MDGAVGFNIFDNIVPIEPKPVAYIGETDEGGNLVFVKKYETKASSFDAQIEEIVEEEKEEMEVWETEQTIIDFTGFDIKVKVVH